MEKEKLFLSGENTMAPAWNSSSFAMEIQSNELNCGSEQLPNCFFNPYRDNSMDHSDLFESALSSMVSSPAASNATGIAGSVGGDGVMLKELIGRLGSICNSGEISPQSYIGGNNSTNTSCYNTPLNSPPKLYLSIHSDRQIRGNLPVPGIQLPSHQSLTLFSADPGFSDRAARFSCFSTRNFGSPNGQFGVNESEFPQRSSPRVDFGNLSSVSSSNSSKIAGSPMDVQENKDFLSSKGNSASEKKFSRLSRSSTPEATDFEETREESSVSEQIPGGESGVKSQIDANARKRKSIPKGKAKEIPSSSPDPKDSKVVAEHDELSAKRNKQNESGGNEKDGGKAKAEANGNGNPKQPKETPKPPEPSKDYIHVRARRGQATDSHSLAERVRREKISERMKFLQDLVPGCNKVTGKAIMLDEIINYVQSLQRQVEFLSMKLSAVNPRAEFNMDTLLSKDMFPSGGGSVPNNIHALAATSPAFPYGFQSAHGGIANGRETPLSLNPFVSAHRRNPMPPIDVFGEAASQGSGFWEDDLQSVVQMGFWPESATGSAQMKVEP